MIKNVKVPIKTDDEAVLPEYITEVASGADVRANIPEDVEIMPGESVAIPTGLRVAIPRGYEFQIRPRSGLALKHQVTVLNTPGTIDADYRGEIRIILINHGREVFVVTPRMRIAQMVLTAVVQANFIVEECLGTTLRGDGGFGHTGLQ